jgi:hypothetical protein
LKEKPNSAEPGSRLPPLYDLPTGRLGRLQAGQAAAFSGMRIAEQIAKARIGRQAFMTSI